MSAPTTNISQWNSSDFMQFVSSVGFSGNTYNTIKQVMEDNSLEVKDIKGTAEELASLFSIHKIIAKKIRTPLYKLRLQQGLNTTVNTTQHKTNNTNLNNASYDNEKFCVNFRGKQGKHGTLKKTFSRNDTISSVALAYRDEECVNQNTKVEKIILQSGGQVLQHDKKLRDYQIVSENNLITVIFKTIGGSDFASKTVDKWTTDDLQCWIKTLNVQNEEQQKILLSIIDNGLTGADLKDESCEDVAGVLDITNELAKVLHDGFNNWTVIEATTGHDDMKLNQQNDESNISTKSDIQYYVGYKLDCKDSNKVWCPSEVLSVDSSCITIKYSNWRDPNNHSSCQEDTIYHYEFADRLKEYGVMTNKSCKSNRVYSKKRKYHPTKKQAKQVRQAQEKQLKKLMKENINESSDGWVNKLTSAASAVGSYVGYNGNNGYNDGYNNGYGYSGYNNGYSISGIIGLRNLGNQCYMNSAIQLIAQTPPLFVLFRNMKNTSNQPLLFEFMNLSKAANSSSSSSYAPKQIKTILLNEDYSSFGDYSQQDAGHALSTLLIKLDKELLDNKNYQSKSMNCIRKNGLESDMEGALIEQIMEEYNPGKQSVVRDTMTFLFRKMYSCLAPNCDYVEWRYNLGSKLVLPLENHSIIVPAHIYITDKVFTNEFSCVSYCGASTLMAQIHDFLRNKNKNKTKKYDIHLYTVEMHNSHSNKLKLIDPNQLLKSISLDTKCSDLVNKVILVAATSINTNDNDIEMKEQESFANDIMMKQFCIYKTKEKIQKLHLNIVSIKRGTNINDISIPNINGNVCKYYQGRIVDKNASIMVNNNVDNSMVILYDVDLSFSDDGYDNISNTWKFMAYDPDCKYKSMFNYNKVAQKLKLMAQRIGSTPFENEEKKLKMAISSFGKMANNQQIISKHIAYVLNSMNDCKCYKKLRKPLNNLNDCLDTYLEEQVLDSGARIKCTNCQNYCQVFKQTTQIVRYPRIMTILFDRFDDGRKYDHKINFNKTMKRFNPCQYELYGVCNHTSSSTDYGHYYSYVKSVDKNSSKWYNANDSSISPIKNETRITNNKSALILMFERK